MKQLSLTIKFRILHFVTHCLAVFGIFWALREQQLHWFAVAFVCFLFAGIIGVNVSLHRFFSHNSFKTGPVGFWFLLISSVMPLLGSPSAWGSIHRYHHANSDTERDPHNPNRIGFFRSWITSWPAVEMPLSIFRSLVRDRRVYYLDRHYFSIVYAYLFSLLVIDWRLACFVFAIPAVGCFHGAAAIATIPHTDGLGGYRNHETSDNSYNSPLAWILSLGEGWHNNHHHAPHKYRHGEKPWELDPSAFIIKNFLMKAEQTSELRVETAVK